MKTLVDRFNTMAKSIVRGPGLEHVTHLDLREVLSNRLEGKEYKKWWANELHPTPRGLRSGRDEVPRDDSSPVMGTAGTRRRFPNASA